MSRTALRKELEALSAEQLRQLVLDAYDARKETKEYFEFFLNPNVDNMLERQTALIAKELNRTKWGRSRGRVTIIKKAVRDFISLNPGPEHCLDMLMGAVAQIGIADSYVDLTPALEKLALTLTTEFFVLADKALLAEQANDRFTFFMADKRLRPAFRSFVAQSVGRDV